MFTLYANEPKFKELGMELVGVCWKNRLLLDGAPEADSLTAGLAVERLNLTDEFVTVEIGGSG